MCCLLVTLWLVTAHRYILRHDMKDVVMTILCTYHDQNAHLDLIWLNSINEAASVAKKVRRQRTSRSAPASRVEAGCVQSIS